jgi:hypothetical protein
MSGVQRRSFQRRVTHDIALSACEVQCILLANDDCRYIGPALRNNGRVLSLRLEAGRIGGALRPS